MYLSQPSLSTNVQTDLAQLRSDLQTLLASLFDRIEPSLETEKREKIMQEFDRSDQLLKKFGIL